MMWSRLQSYLSLLFERLQQVSAMAFARFTSVSAEQIEQILEDKDSENTKKVQKCLLLLYSFVFAIFVAYL